MVTSGFADLDPVMRGFFAELRTRGFQRMLRFSPDLVAALHLDASTAAPVLREHIRRRLLASAEELDQSLGTVFVTVAGFRHDSPTEVSARLRAAAEPVGLSERTVRRRFEEGCVRIASILESVETRSVLADIDYVYVNSRTWIDLRDDQPSFVVTRTLRARSDRISHVDDRYRLPRFTGDQLALICLEGCSATRPHLVGASIWGTRLSFPRELRVGEQHTFAVSLRLPERDSLEPFVGFLPHTTNMDASVELLFGGNRPALIERFAAPPPVDGMDRIPGSELIRPVEARHSFVFDQMRPGICYGVRWQWDAPA